MCTKRNVVFHLFVVFCEISTISSNLFPNSIPDSKTASVHTFQDKTDCSCSNKPSILLYHAPTQEEFSLSFTRSTIEVKGDPNITTGSATGGNLGNTNLTFYKFSLHWTVCDNKVTFESYILYFDKNYGTFENAVQHGAVLLTVVPIEANGWIDDPLFCKLEKVMQKIKKPGDCIDTHSTLTYIWFRNFPLLASYNSFKGSYIDKATGQLYEGITVNRLPPEPWRNFMSRRQFDSAFGHLLTDSSGQSIDNSPPEIKPLSAPVKGSGLVVKLVLG